jgi:hypothetical protein
MPAAPAAQDSRMPRNLVIPGTLALVALLLPPAAPAPAVVPLDMIGLPGPTDVVHLIDTLTRKDSETSVEVKLGKPVSQGKLLVARTRVEVAMERSTRNWRGPVQVHMTVPSDISYSINLAAIRAENIRVDAKKRLLVVTMPPPEVEDVTPLLPKVTAENSFKRCRFRRFDADACRELQNTMLKEDYQLRARKEGEARLTEVREQARAALADLLETLLRVNCPGIRVRVE